MLLEHFQECGSHACAGDLDWLDACAGDLDWLDACAGDLANFVAAPDKFS